MYSVISFLISVFINSLFLLNSRSTVIKSPVNGNLDIAQSVRIKNYKILFGSFEFQKPLVLALNQSSVEITSGQESISTGNKARMTRKQRFVLIGNGKGRESDLSITRIVAWQPHSGLLKKALKNAKRGDCVKFLKESQDSTQDEQQSQPEKRDSNQNNQNTKRPRNRGQKKNRRGQKRTSTTPTPTTLSS